MLIAQVSSPRFRKPRLQRMPAQTGTPMESQACPSCGARAGGRAECQGLFDQLGALAWSDPRRAAVHNLVVDAYCLQHPDQYCESAKSYAAHLTRLCCALEFGGQPCLYWAIPRWLDGKVQLQKPLALRVRGAEVGREGPTSEAVGVARSGRRDGRRCTRRSEQRCVCRTRQGMGQVRVGGLRVTTGLGKGVDAGGRWSVVSSVILQCTPSPPTTINTHRLTRGRGGLCHGSSRHWLASSTGCPQGPPSWTSAAAQGITRAPSPSTVLTLSVPASTFPSPCSARQRRVRRERGSSLAMR